MARWQWSLPLTLGFCTLAAGRLAAQTPTERLDDLLSQWRGQTVAHVREVWGREQETEMREKVARTSRQGGGQECWNVWRRNEP